MRAYFLILIILILPKSIFAQSSEDMELIKLKRLNRIDFYHVAFGAEADMYKNFTFAPEIFAGIGSYHNLLTFDIGMKYRCYSTRRIADEKLSLQYFSPFASVDLNLFRWLSGCGFVGTEFMYSIVSSAKYKHISNKIVHTDNNLAKNHLSGRIKLGLKTNKLNIHGYFGYHLSPPINQKYIFESIAYEYDRLSPVLFERVGAGLSVSYYIFTK